ncbi:MAG: hypothetical protein SGARI_005782 [Bacillariaceae sp.]
MRRRSSKKGGLKNKSKSKTDMLPSIAEGAEEERPSKMKGALPEGINFPSFKIPLISDPSCSFESNDMAKKMKELKHEHVKEANTWMYQIFSDGSRDGTIETIERSVGSHDGTVDRSDTLDGTLSKSTSDDDSLLFNNVDIVDGSSGNSARAEDAAPAEKSNEYDGNRALDVALDSDMIECS